MDSNAHECKIFLPFPACLDMTFESNGIFYPILLSMMLAFLELERRRPFQPGPACRERKGHCALIITLVDSFSLLLLYTHQLSSVSASIHLLTSIHSFTLLQHPFVYSVFWFNSARTYRYHALYQKNRFVGFLSIPSWLSAARMFSSRNGDEISHPSSNSKPEYFR